MMSMNFKHWLRVPQLVIGYLSPLRRAALVGGTAFASLAMTAASVPADARTASAPVGMTSTDFERPAMDEFSSRRGHHGGKGGGYGAGYAGGGYGDRSFKSKGGYKAGYSGGGYGDRSFKRGGYARGNGSTFGRYGSFGPRAYW